MSVDQIIYTRTVLGRLEVRHNLMTKKLKIDPLARAAPLGAAEYPTIETPRFYEVRHRKSDVERRQCVHVCHLMVVRHCQFAIAVLSVAINAIGWLTMT